jgi:short-subunit dehydrogenase
LAHFWKSKTALVTGGSSGLGLAIAAALVREGADVAIVARSANRLESAAKTLQTEGSSKVLPISADITRPEDVKRMISTAVERFGKLNLLVNCAGSSARGDVLSTSTEDFRRLMELNFLALVECTRAALPHLLKTQGHVINIGSLASKSASRYMGGYAASKFAVAAYSQQLRLELSDQGLHVLLVCPGPIASETRRVYSGTENLPQAARQAGAGVRVKQIDPQWLATQILKACHQCREELIVPGKARFLFALSQLSPKWGDWLLRKMTS